MDTARSVEGAPLVPDQTGSAGVANEALVDALFVLLGQIVAANRERAVQLRRDADIIAGAADQLCGKLQLALASSKLRKRCDLVSFF